MSAKAPKSSIHARTLTASKARTSLYRLIDQTAASHQPVTISGKRSSAVLVSSEDWSAIQETLFLLSIPGMRKSIRDGMEISVADCSAELKW
jgi:antitoxin YefM